MLLIERGATTYDDKGHSPFVFSSCPESGHHEDCNRYWDCCEGQAELRIGDLNYHNYELDGETEEEEEVEFKKGDVDLQHRKHSIMGDYV